MSVRIAKLAAILELETVPVGPTLEEHAAEIMQTRRDAYQKSFRLSDRVTELEIQHARDVAIIAALRNDVEARAVDIEKLEGEKEALKRGFENVAHVLERIEDRANSRASGARYAHYRLERLADVMLDLVGALVTVELQIQAADGLSALREAIEIPYADPEDLGLPYLAAMENENSALWSFFLRTRILVGCDEEDDCKDVLRKLERLALSGEARDALADATLNLVGGVLDEIELQEIEALETPGDYSI